MKQKTKITLGELNKSNVWTITAGELSQMIIDAKKKRDEFSDNEKRYTNIIKTVFDIQYLKREDSEAVRKLEETGYEVFSTTEDNGNNAIAIRKHPVKKVTDLTLENIQHMEPWEVLDLINHNMGTGWKGLTLAIQDIIETAFFVDCTVMPATIMRKPGGIIERRKDDGYEVLEIERGTWIEAIFIKPKPRVEKIHIDYSIPEEEDGRKKRRKRMSEENYEEGEEDYDDIPIEEEDEEDMDEEELKKLDGDMDEDEEDEDEELDESEIQIEDIESIEEIADEED